MSGKLEGRERKGERRKRKGEPETGGLQVPSLLVLSVLKQHTL